MAVGVPLCHSERTAYAANGEFAAVAVPLTLIDGSNGVQVTVVSVRGDTVLHRRVPLAASPIADAARDSAIDARRGGGSGALRELVDEMVERDLVPRFHSPLLDLRVSDVGDVVVGVVSGRGAERHFVIIRRGGRAVMMLPMRPNQSLRWFGGNQLLLAEEDEDGLQDVVLYEVVGS